MVAIGHLILNVSDFPRSRSFYDSLLTGLGVRTRVVHDDEETKIVAYDIPGAPVYLRWARDETPSGFVRNVGLDHLCLLVDAREDVDRVWQSLQDAAAVVTRPPREYPEYTDRYYAVYFRDPDGIPLEVAFL